MEDWDAECKSQPEPAFTVLTTISTSQPLIPKDLFLRYLKSVHGRDTAHRVREELGSQHITNSNFNRWKAESSQKMTDKLNNPLKTFCAIISNC